MDSPASRLFEGTSNTTNFDEALAAALQQAQEAANPDELLNWELVATRGHYGGVAGQHQLTVAIEVADQASKGLDLKQFTKAASLFNLDLGEADAMPKSLLASAAVPPAQLELSGAAGADVSVAIAYEPADGTFLVKKNSPRPVADGDFHSVGEAPGTHVYEFNFYRRPWSASLEVMVEGKTLLEERKNTESGNLLRPDVWTVVIHASGL